MEALTFIEIMKTKGLMQKIKLQLTQTNFVYQDHIGFAYPSKWQLPMGMENFLMCKIVV